MILKDYFSNSLEARLARHLRAMNGQLFYPELVWGIIKPFQGKKGKYYRAFVRAGTNNSLDPNHEIWKSKKSLSKDKLEEDLIHELTRAAKRFNLTFRLMEEDPDADWRYRVKKTIQTNWLTETNMP